MDENGTVTTETMQTTSQSTTSSNSVIKCLSPFHVPHSTLVCDHDKFIFTCDNGYTMQGDAVYVLSNNGSSVADIPNCVCKLFILLFWSALFLTVWND